MTKKGLICIFLFIMCASILAISSIEIRRQFYTEYYAWKLYTKLEGADKGDLTENIHYQKMITLGPPIVPLLFHELEYSNDGLLISPIITITKRVYRWDEIKNIKGQGALAQLYIQWWYHGRFQTLENFEKFYTLWSESRKRGDSISERKYQIKIEDLGLPVLPFLVDKIEKGKTELLPMVKWLTDGRVPTEKLTPANIRVWWEENKDQWTLPKR